MKPVCPARSSTSMPAGTITASTSRRRVKGSLLVSVHGRLRRVHSVVTGAAARSSAALSVCQQRLAHFTRAGNSRTPESAASLPSSSRHRRAHRAASARRARRRTGAATSARDLPLTASVSSDADATEIAQPLPSNADVGDAIAVELHVDRQLVAAQRIEARPRARSAGSSLPKLRGLPVVVEDDVAIEVFEVHASAEHLARVARAPRPAASISVARVVERERSARRCGHAEELHHRHRAVMSGAHRDAFGVENRAEVVRVDARRS